MKERDQHLSPVASPFNWREARIQAWDCRDPEEHIRLSAGDKPIKWLQAKLGKQTRCVKYEGHRWWAWEDPDYILWADCQGEIYVEVPEGVPPEQASEFALWDCGVLKRAITRTEYLKWVQVGREFAEPFIKDFPSYDQKQLKQFVLDYCDGRLYCDHQCDPGIIQMVFMPLALGAFASEAPDKLKGTEGCPVWHAEQKLPKSPGPKPRSEAAPKPPEKPEYPAAPIPPTVIYPDPDKEKRIASKYITIVEVQAVTDLFVEGTDDPQEVQDYRDAIEIKNAAQEALHAAAMVKWDQAKDTIDKAHQDAQEAHERAMQEWREAKVSLDTRTAQWAREDAISTAAWRGFTSTRLQQLGVIYEEISQAGPRSVNGQPIFWSFKTLNRSDWKRAYAAILRELSRREEDMEI
jgi:hypothetical protein